MIAADLRADVVPACGEHVVEPPRRARFPARSRDDDPGVDVRKPEHTATVQRGPRTAEGAMREIASSRPSIDRITKGPPFALRGRRGRSVDGDALGGGRVPWRGRRRAARRRRRGRYRTAAHPPGRMRLAGRYQNSPTTSPALTSTDAERSWGGTRWKLYAPMPAIAVNNRTDPAIAGPSTATGDRQPDVEDDRRREQYAAVEQRLPVDDGDQRVDERGSERVDRGSPPGRRNRRARATVRR